MVHQTAIIRLFPLPIPIANGISAPSKKRFLAPFLLELEAVVKDLHPDVAGEDSVGIGTDFTQGYGRKFFHWITHDKGYARRLTEFGEIVNPEGIRTIGELPNLTAAMVRQDWPGARIRKIMGENWLSLLARVWGE